MRYAKTVADHEKQGGNVADLPPPPVSENPDYVQCPYCERKFNPGTAERHIPRCKDIKSRPAPPKKRKWECSYLSASHFITLIQLAFVEF